MHRSETRSPKVLWSCLAACTHCSGHIIVEPEQGTGFAWLTVASRTVIAGGTLEFSALVVPAPIAIDITLKQETENGLAPIAGGVVRAYAPGTPPVMGALPPQIELGTWLTDANGAFTMLVVPPACLRSRAASAIHGPTPSNHNLFPART